MNILVTGAAGFIGSNLTKTLLRSGHQVIGIDNLDPFYPVTVKQSNLSSLHSFDSFTFHKLDIRDPSLTELVRTSHPDAIVHLAAKAGVRNSLLFPTEYTDVNVTGTMRVMEAAKEAGIQKILIASSSSVYGTNTKVPFSETDIVENQISPYAASKRAIEVMCKMCSKTYGLHIQLFRFFTVYGPSGRPDMAPFLFTKALLEDKPITVFGSTKTERDYTYIDDIVDGLIRALKRDDLFEIYNLGNNSPTPLGEFIHILEEETGHTAKLVVRAPQQGDVERTWADISKAHENLGYYPKTPLKRGLHKFVDWYIKNQTRYI